MQSLKSPRYLRSFNHDAFLENDRGFDDLGLSPFGAGNDVEESSNRVEEMFSLGQILVQRLHVHFFVGLLSIARRDAVRRADQVS